mmetsp:Transcript_35152/g.104932  ORF Transcript_35152/g.104932 Transcript_35152/m.104932 type:complete len:290 (+) Transcript_35152:128-997(+)
MKIQIHLTQPRTGEFKGPKRKHSLRPLGIPAAAVSTKLPSTPPPSCPLLASAVAAATSSLSSSPPPWYGATERMEPSIPSSGRTSTAREKCSGPRCETPPSPPMAASTWAWRTKPPPPTAWAQSWPPPAGAECFTSPATAFRTASSSRTARAGRSSSTSRGCGTSSRPVRAAADWGTAASAQREVDCASSSSPPVTPSPPPALSSVRARRGWCAAAATNPLGTAPRASLRGHFIVRWPADGRCGSPSSQRAVRCGPVRMWGAPRMRRTNLCCCRRMEITTQFCSGRQRG